MNYDIFLVGVGGQGVLTIAELITEAAFLEGIPANYYPTEGMAQRGGFVKAQVRLGRQFVGPNLPEKGADAVISMEVSESLKAIRYIKPGGDFIIWGHVWAPTAVMLGKASYPTVDKIKEQVLSAGANLTFLSPDVLPLYEGNSIPENIYTLGASVGNSKLNQVIQVESFSKAIKNKWPKDSGRNIYAFEVGLDTQKVG
jgi:indolepyruvate ferredoxin oxidoreductase, beta subunit